MENIKITGTSTKPEVFFESGGKFSISGKSIPDNAVKLFEPLHNYVLNFNSDRIELDINLEYLNTSSSMQLFTLLRNIENNSHVKDILVTCHFS